MPRANNKHPENTFTKTLNVSPSLKKRGKIKCQEPDSLLLTPPPTPLRTPKISPRSSRSNTIITTRIPPPPKNRKSSVSQVANPISNNCRRSITFSDPVASLVSTSWINSLKQLSADLSNLISPPATPSSTPSPSSHLHCPFSTYSQEEHYDSDVVVLDDHKPEITVSKSSDETSEDLLKKPVDNVEETVTDELVPDDVEVLAVIPRILKKIQVDEPIKRKRGRPKIKIENKGEHCQKDRDCELGLSLPNPQTSEDLYTIQKVKLIRKKSVECNSSFLDDETSVSQYLHQDAEVSQSLQDETAVREYLKNETSVSVSLKKDTSVSQSLKKDTFVSQILKKDTSVSQSQQKDTIISKYLQKETDTDESLQKDTAVTKSQQKDTAISQYLQKDTPVSLPLHKDEAVSESLHKDTAANQSQHKDAAVSLPLHKDIVVSISLHKDTAVSLSLHEDTVVSQFPEKETNLRQEDTNVSQSRQKNISVSKSLHKNKAACQSLHKDKGIRKSLRKEKVISQSLQKDTAVSEFKEKDIAAGESLQKDIAVSESLQKDLREIKDSKRETRKRKLCVLTDAPINSIEFKTTELDSVKVQLKRKSKRKSFTKEVKHQLVTSCKEQSEEESNPVPVTKTSSDVGSNITENSVLSLSVKRPRGRPRGRPPTKKLALESESKTHSILVPNVPTTNITVYSHPKKLREKYNHKQSKTQASKAILKKSSTNQKLSSSKSQEPSTFKNQESFPLTLLQPSKRKYNKSVKYLADQALPTSLNLYEASPSKNQGCSTSRSQKFSPFINQEPHSSTSQEAHRPSRTIQQPARYLDSIDTATKDSIAVMRLHQMKRGKGLTYDLNNLSWNKDHTINEQRVYCYCGDPGSWYSKMVQCSRCHQWFHERCLAPRPMAMPIIFGDLFYLFVCSSCNHGSECLKRMDISWTDLVHLALFDLTIKTSRTFHDFEKDLVPDILTNWPLFQMPKLKNLLSEDEKTEMIRGVLFENKGRFINGLDAQQSATLWGLELLSPPPRPNYKVPEVGIISERTVLNEVVVDQRKYNPNAENVMPTETMIVKYDQYLVPVPNLIKTIKAKKVSSNKLNEIKAKKVSSNKLNESVLLDKNKSDIEHKTTKKRLKLKSSHHEISIDPGKETNAFQIQVNFLKKRHKNSGKSTFRLENINLKVQKVKKAKGKKISKDGDGAEIHSTSAGVTTRSLSAEVPSPSAGVTTRSLSKSEPQPKTPQVLRYELNKRLHKQGFPRIAMKFGEILPKSREEMLPLLQAQPSVPKSRKNKRKQGAAYYRKLSEPLMNAYNGSSILDTLIPAPQNYSGPNNPFNTGSLESQRLRRLTEQDLTKCRSRIKKRKDRRMVLEESRQLWSCSQSVNDNIGALDYVKTKRKNLLKGKVCRPDGKVQYL